MSQYRVRVIWRVETEETVQAENTLQAEDKARKKAMRTRQKPPATEIVETKVVCVVNPRR